MQDALNWLWNGTTIHSKAIFAYLIALVGYLLSHSIHTLFLKGDVAAFLHINTSWCGFLFLTNYAMTALLHWWYLGMEALFENEGLMNMLQSMPYPRIIAATVKCVLEMAVFTPFVSFLFAVAKCFLLSFHICSWQFVFSVTKSLSLHTIMFWSPVQLVSYGLVPVHMRTRFGNLVGIFWNMLLSILYQD
jgi:hypothetical protein